MKKFVSLALVLLLAVAMAVPAFAADGINANERKVLDLLSQSITVDGQQFVIPVDYVNQAENYFNTIEMTAQEADEIAGYIQSGMDYFVSSGAKDIAGLTYEQKLFILDCGKKAVGVLGMTLTADFVGNTVTILSPDGTVAFSAPATIHPLVPVTPTEPGTSGGGNKPGGGTIKPTGSESDATVAIMLSSMIVLFVAAAGIYLAKTRKSRA